MSYSITIYVWDVNKQVFSSLYYENKKSDNVFEDILESYDSYSGFHTEFETSSESFEKNIYDVARFIVGSHYTFQYAVGDSIKDESIVTLITEFIDDVTKQKEDKKLINLFNEIKFLPKKYCVNNSLSYNYIEEWIEVIFGSRLIEKFYPDINSSSNFVVQKLEIENFLKNGGHTKILIKEGKVPMFFYNQSDLVFFSFNFNWIDSELYKYRDSKNISSSDQLMNFEYTFFFYDEEIIIKWIIDLLKRKNENLSDLLNDSTLDTELCLSNDLVLKIFIRPKSFN